MELKLKDLRSSKNPKARIKILQGHFATGNSHINTYIDMSTVKTRHNNAREAAKELAKEYLTTTMVDTIVCLDETEVIGTFLADIFRAKIVDVEEDSLIIELTGTQSKLEAFLNLLRGYEILELARTGITGLSRGSKDVAYF